MCPRAEAGLLDRFLRVMQSLLPQVVAVVGVSATERGWNLPHQAASGLAFQFCGHWGQCVIEGRGMNLAYGEGLGVSFGQQMQGCEHWLSCQTDVTLNQGSIACLWRSDLSFLECKMALMLIDPCWDCFGLNELCLAFSRCSTAENCFDQHPGTSGRTGIRGWCCPKVLIPTQPACLPKLCHL